MIPIARKVFIILAFSSFVFNCFKVAEMLENLSVSASVFAVVCANGDKISKKTFKIIGFYHFICIFARSSYLSYLYSSMGFK